MYFPSFLFGGSSFIHLLASHPRVVSVFGLGALLSTMLWSPFGTPNVPGAAGQLSRLEQHAPVTEDSVQQAQESARVTAQESTPAQLASIVDTTLARCGVACADVARSSVLADPLLLQDVLLLHALEEAREQRLATRPTAVVNTGGQ